MQQPSTLTTSTPPWQQKQLSSGLKLLTIFGAALLLIVALIGGIIWFTMVPEMIVTGPGPNDTVRSMFTQGLSPLTVMISAKLALALILANYS